MTRNYVPDLFSEKKNKVLGQFRPQRPFLSIPQNESLTTFLIFFQILKISRIFYLNKE
jgi:hypothetical protein